MAYIRKPPQFVSRLILLEVSVSELLDEYARFVGCTPDHVANGTLKKALWRDQEYRQWWAKQKTAAEGKPNSETKTA